MVAVRDGTPKGAFVSGIILFISALTIFIPKTKMNKNKNKLNNFFIYILTYYIILSFISIKNQD